MIYTELILPLATNSTYHYYLGAEDWTQAPEELIGCRVQVSFGRRRFYTAIVLRASNIPPNGLAGKELKRIEAILDERPLVSTESLQFWHWIADYYHCSLGQVMRTALPGNLLPESQTRVIFNEDFIASSPLSKTEIEILDLIAKVGNKGLSMEALRQRLGHNATRSLEHLIKLGAISTEEQIKQRYKARTLTHLSLAEAYQTDEALEVLIRKLEKVSRQEALLLGFLSLLEESGASYEAWLTRKAVLTLKDASASTLKTMINKGIFRQERKEISRLPQASKSAEQLSEKRGSLDLRLAKPTTLLVSKHRIDKDEALYSLIAKTLEGGKQVLLLSPSAYELMGDKPLYTALLALPYPIYRYSPQTSEALKAEVYRELTDSSAPCLVLGARTAVFLPLKNLGLIIVDEEQDYNHKWQFSPPYYHTRDIALYLGSRGQIPLVLSSQSPSLESLFNAERGKYARLDLGSSTPPEVDIQMIDTKRERRAKGEMLTASLRTAMEQTLEEGKRILLLQNRKGYSPAIACGACGERMHCPHCDVSLTFFGEERQLRCNYCDYITPAPSVCPTCGTSRLKNGTPSIRAIGYGTERIAEELEKYFPEASILRLDAESLQSASSRQEIGERLRSGDVDIILGTQLIAQHAIFADIGLVGILDLGSLLSMPDFRAEERTYQLLRLLALHSASEGYRPKMLLQAPFSQPKTGVRYQDFVTTLLSETDGTKALNNKLIERQKLGFPPFVRLSYIRLSAGDEQLVEQVGRAFAQILADLLATQYAPLAASISTTHLQKPAIARINLQYLRLIVCRRSYKLGYQAERQLWRDAEERLYQQEPLARRVRIVYDVDPV